MSGNKILVTYMGIDFTGMELSYLIAFASLLPEKYLQDVSPAAKIAYYKAKAAQEKV